MRIAIVGAGVSGLMAAHLLHRRHDITVFEAASRIGGHTHTALVESGGRQHAVDTGFIVYNETTYPHFTRLLEQLEVETQPTDMSFGVHCEKTGLSWASRGLDSVFAQRRNLLRPSFHRMLRDVLRFNQGARELLETDDEKTTLGDYLCGAGYGREFVDHYVLPMGAAIWSADPRSFLQFPAASFVRFFANHGLLESPPSVQWRVIAGGSGRYLEKLVAPFRDRISLSTPVRAIRRRKRFVEIHAGDKPQIFDHVILAVHSDQALNLLVDVTGLERAVLRSIRYQRNEVVLHSDESLLPSNRRARASWNYLIPRDSGAPAVVTYDMSRLQGLDTPERFLVTLNATDRIDRRRIHRELVYHHPIFDADAIAAQKLHSQISEAGRTHFCGAWWGYGFHEDGVRSAIQVCERLGVTA